MTMDVYERLMSHWKEFDDLVDASLKDRDYIKEECAEIKTEARTAMKNLASLFEDIKQRIEGLKRDGTTNEKRY